MRRHADETPDPLDELVRISEEMGFYDIEFVDGRARRFLASLSETPKPWNIATEAELTELLATVRHEGAFVLMGFILFGQAIGNFLRARRIFTESADQHERWTIYEHY